jgi:hypothetical protein
MFSWAPLYGLFILRITATGKRCSVHGQRTRGHYCAWCIWVGYILVDGHTLLFNAGASLALPCVMARSTGLGSSWLYE